jgi:peptidoglycan/LPS O-acetylase OafA/YrhL
LAHAEKRVRGIDVLRGLCIIAVILNHINLRIRLNQSWFGKSIGEYANHALVWNGHYGVRVFFVISGFLITSWSLRRWSELRQISLRQFYAMRFARIVPCLLGLLAILALLDRLNVPRFTINTQHTTLVHALFAALTFHINWLEARTGYLPAAWDILWSLSVEEVFYLFFPIVCATLRKPALLSVAFLSFVVVGPFARMLTHGLWNDYAYSCCMDGIAIGCLGALVCGRCKLGRKTNLAFKIVGASLAILITIFTHIAYLIGFAKVGTDETVLEIGIALLLIAFQQSFEQQSASTNEPGEPRSKSLFATIADWPPAALRWFGQNSYEVYLTHMLVVWPMVGLFYLTRQSIDAAPVWFIGTILLAGVLGQFVARFYSEPLNRKLRKLLIARGQAHAGPATAALPSSG